MTSWKPPRVRCLIDGRAVSIYSADVRRKRGWSSHPFLIKLVGYDSPAPAYGEAVEVAWDEAGETMMNLTITGWRVLPEEEPGA